MEEEEEGDTHCEHTAVTAQEATCQQALLLLVELSFPQDKFDG